MMDMPCLLVVRIRGQVDVPYDVEHTLKLLRLRKRYHATLVKNDPQVLGMLKKAEPYITWGEPALETIVALLSKRAKVRGNEKLTDEYVRKHTKYQSIEELAKALYDCEVDLKDVPGLKPVFRLHPPRKGLKGTIKKHFVVGGAYGYRGVHINDLVMRML